MDSIKKYKKILIGIGVILLGFFVYSFFFSGEEEPTLATEPLRTSVTQAEADILSLLNQLRSITLDTSLFDRARFRTLRDFSVTLTPEPVGRPNPFLPPNAGEASVFDDTSGDESIDPAEDTTGESTDGADETGI